MTCAVSKGTGRIPPERGRNTAAVVLEILEAISKTRVTRVMGAPAELFPLLIARTTCSVASGLVPRALANL